MIVAAICEENIEAAGFVLDTGPVRLTERSRPRSLPKWKRWLLFLRLAVRFPNEYSRPFLRKLGLETADFYERLRKAEKRLTGEVLRACNPHFDAALVPQIRRFPTFREASAKVGAPYHEVNNINSEEAGAILRSMQPDVVVSLGDRILKPHTLKIPRLGVLNGHSSLLPAYRGTSTEFWQLAHGEMETGVTIHWMATRVDEGNILVQARWPIPSGATHWELRRVSQFLRIPAWRKAIRLVGEGHQGTPQGRDSRPTFGQPDIVALYSYYIRREVMRPSPDLPPKK
jgi:folate-dependent phosphoribosylglycinamide formyltransferase PurN